MALAALVSGCSTSNEKPSPVIRTAVLEPAIVPEADQKCPAPVTMPDRDLSEEETAAVMATDRANLRICEERRAAGVASAKPAFGHQ